MPPRRNVRTPPSSDSGEDEGAPVSEDVGSDDEKGHGDHQHGGHDDDDDEPVAAGSRHAGLPKKHPRTITMITEALGYLDEKSGSTSVAVKAYIQGKHRELDQGRFNAQFKRAFLKGIADGILLRTTATADSEGLDGKVKLAPSKPKRATVPKESVRKTKEPEAQEPEPEESQQAEGGVNPAEPVGVPKKAPRKGRKAPDTKPSEPKPDALQPIEESSEEPEPPEPPKKPKARVPRKKPTSEAEPMEQQAEAGPSGRQRAQRSTRASSRKLLPS